MFWKNAVESGKPRTRDFGLLGMPPQVSACTKPASPKIHKTNQSYRGPQYDAGAAALHPTVLGHDFTRLGEAES